MLFLISIQSKCGEMAASDMHRFLGSMNVDMDGMFSGILDGQTAAEPGKRHARCTVGMIIVNPPCGGEQR